MLNYSMMKEQIRRETNNYYDNENMTGLEYLKPQYSYKKGKVEVTLNTINFSKNDFADLIDTLHEYYSVIDNVESGYVYSFGVKRDKYNFEKKTDEQEKRDKAKIICKEEICFDRNERIWKITFEKETEFYQEEVNCILDLWQKYSLPNKLKQKDPKDLLEDYGAIVYQDEGLDWDSFAGYDDVKKQIQNTVMLPLKNAEIYRQIGNITRVKYKDNIPRAVLFEGPPGTGKTTVARIIGCQSGVPLVYVPVESIMSMWYGASEKRLANIFDLSNKLDSCVLFLDEIDSLAGSRGNDMHEATRRILSVLLRKMQGISATDKIITIGATNRAEDLDMALLSRFNRRIEFPLPTESDRSLITKYYAKQLNDDELQQFAEATSNKSGRDLEDICSDAERRWAQKLILDKLEISAPPLEMYLEAAKSK